MTWRRTASGELPAVLHIIFPASQIASGVPDTYRFWKKTDNIVILPSLVKQGPSKLRRVFIKRGSALEQVTGPGEELSIGTGFNMELTPQDNVLVGGRQLKPIAIDAVPGAGAGQYLRCIRNAYLITLTGVPAGDNGNTKLFPEECYWLERPLTSGPTIVEPVEHGITYSGELASNALQLHNSCGPCCSCDDYIATYAHMREIWDRARTVSSGYYDLRLRYYALIAAYNEAVGALAGLLSITQYLDDYMVVQLRLINDSAVVIPAGVTLSLSFVLSAGTYAYSPGSGVVSGPGVSQQLDPTDPNGDPELIFDFALQARTSTLWTGMWKLTGMVAADTVTATVVVSNGIDDSAAVTLTIE